MLWDVICRRWRTVQGWLVASLRYRHCKDVMAAYRATRRAAGKDQPRTPRRVDTDGHIGRDWFRRNVWLKALDIAQLGFHVTPNHLRHAHASWLLAGGADIQVVKERLGHGSITTTERYTPIRRRMTPPSAHSPGYGRGGRRSTPNLEAAAGVAQLVIVNLIRQAG